MTNFGDLARVLEQQIENWEPRASSDSTGFVVQVGDSVATVYGLDKAIYGELVEFSSGATGIVLNLEEEGVGCVLLSGESLVKDGEEVRGTGKVVSVPSGPSLLGRVLNPLGEVVDGKGPVTAEAFLPVESPAPPVI
ncbi:MAG: F0F1 ATP synthase subunit alpha, partial [Treponema sp.]|nr:F0F1 ATP synthase subunit alpha [Treponema sp.]